MGQFVICTLGVFPTGRPAPAVVVPEEALQAASGNEMLVRVSEELRRFDKLAGEAERVFRGERAISHPVLGPMNVKNWRLFHLRHGEHHLRQIAEILADDV